MQTLDVYIGYMSYCVGDPYITIYMLNKTNTVQYI
jgi:hypothetical protein